MMRYHYTSIRMVKIKNISKTKCWWGDGAAGILIHCRRKHKMIQPLAKTVWQYLIKLNIHLVHDPAILFLGIYPREMKMYIHTNTCTQMVIAALFIIVKYWKPLKYPTSEWVNKLIHSYNEILQSKKKKEEEEVVKKEKRGEGEKEMNTKFGWISKSLCWVKKSRSQMATYCLTPVIWQSRKDKTILMEIRSVVPRGSGWKEVGLQGIGNSREFFVLYPDYDGGYTNLYLC